MYLPIPLDSAHSFGRITYHFSDAEIRFADCSRFLSMFDLRYHKTPNLTLRQVGSLTLDFPDSFRITAGQHPVCLPEFSGFAKELFSAFPGLPLLLDLENDVCLSNLLFARLTSVSVLRNDATPEKTVFSFQSAEAAAEITRMADAMSSLGREIGLTDSNVNHFRVKLWGRLGGKSGK